MFNQFNNDQWSSLFWFICGATICITSKYYGLGALNNPGAGFLPFLAGFAISLFSVIGFVESTLKQKKGVQWKSPITNGAMWGRLLLNVCGLFAYAFLLNTLGFTLCTAFYITFLLRVGKTYRWPVAIVGGIVTALSTYGVFVALLKVQFPKGPWGF